MSQFHVYMDALLHEISHERSSYSRKCAAAAVAEEKTREEIGRIEGETKNR